MMCTGPIMRVSCSKNGTRAPGCWKAFCADVSKYPSTLRCAAARIAALTAGAAGRLDFFFFLLAGAKGEPASTQQHNSAAPIAAGIRLRIFSVYKPTLLGFPQLIPIQSRDDFPCE